MEIIRIAGIALSACIFAVFLKSHRSEYGIFIGLISVSIILTMTLPYVSDIINMAKSLSIPGLDIETPIFKILGISFVGQFASEVCKDANEKALSFGVETAAKLIILALSCPIISALFETVTRLIYL